MISKNKKNIEIEKLKRKSLTTQEKALNERALKKVQGGFVAYAKRPEAKQKLWR